MPRIARNVLGWALTMTVVMLAWVLFRAPSVGAAGSYLAGLLSFQGSLLDSANPGKVLEPGFALLWSTLALLAIDVPQHRRDSHDVALQWSWARRGFYYATLLGGLLLFAGESEKAFIYFQF